MNPEQEPVKSGNAVGTDAVPGDDGRSFKTKFEVYGEESIVKQVRPSGGSGRVYLPPGWVGKLVKVIRID